MSKAQFILFVDQVEGGEPAGWPDDVTYFEKEVDISFLPAVGTKFVLSTSYIQSLHGEVAGITYYLDENTFDIELSMKTGSISMEYFLDEENGWKGTS